MIKILNMGFQVALGLTIVSSAWAKADPDALRAVFQSVKSCDSFVRADDQYLLVGKSMISDSVQVLPIRTLAARFELPLAAPALDAVRSGDHLFVLTDKGLEEWDLASRSRVGIYATYEPGAPFAYMQAPTGLLLNGDEIFISHGRLGFSVFNIVTHQLVDQHRILMDQLPLESMAVGIAPAGPHLAVLAVDNFSMVSNGKPAFRGFVFVDLPSHEVVGQVAGLDPGVESVNTVGDRVFVGFNPPIWGFSLSAFLNGHSSASAPLWMRWSFPGQGYFFGKPYVDEKYYYGCYFDPSQIPHRVPKVLDRAEYHLD